MTVAKRIIYKPVVEDDGQHDPAVFFTIDGGHSSSGAGMNGDQGDDHDHYDGRNRSTDEFIFDDNDDDNDKDHDDSHQHTMLAMEMSHDSSFDDEEHFTMHMFGWKDPWLPSVGITLCLETPLLLGAIYCTIHVLGVWFATVPLSLHLLVRLLTTRYQAHAARRDEILGRFRTRMYGSVMAMFDIALMGILYPVIVHGIDILLLTELDGVVSTDWRGHRATLRRLMFLSLFAAMCRTVLGLFAIGLRSATSSMDASFTNRPSFMDRWCKCPSYVLAPFLYLDNHLQRSRLMCHVSESRRKRIRHRLVRTLDVVIVVTIFLLAGSLQSVYRHFIRSSPPNVSNPPDDCDFLDETECWLPFPSFHHLRPDNTTATSWRLNLQSRLLPPLRTGRTMDPIFLNQYDGFSTMGPILLYLDGLKEAHEAGLHQLQGIRDLADSVTNHSVTLLWDVEAAALIPHSAEVDYLDNNHPMVLIFPSLPLHHNRHYAVAVVNALDAKRKRLLPTPGMSRLLAGKVEGTAFDAKRRSRYMDVLIPSLETAAPWFSYSADPLALQLLFDLHTVSEESQLGTVRLVRDTTIQTVSTVDWNWNKHVKTIRTVDYPCDASSPLLARTVHAELDVPWFLDRVGSGARSSTIKSDAFAKNARRVIGKARLIVHIPCSLRQAALHGPKSDGARPLRAILEFGHGLFGVRAEAGDHYLVDMANREGYILLAMDWRGMSRYDLLHTVKLLISSPELFEAMRDNMFQGFANKFALQHFAKGALFARDWLTFTLLSSETKLTVPVVPHPNFVFYGVSQGGILGAGYTALSGKVGLIDRSIIVSAGTPFASVMTRSTDFTLFDQLFRINFFNDRHIRSALALVQLAWDPVEASGTLALPVNEPFPPVLMQAGLGDPTVAASSSESLARAFNATTLPGNPRPVFGLPTGNPSNKSATSSHATFTEILYQHEYASLPEDDYFPPWNDIHNCLRSDRAMGGQIVAFINTGAIEDPCAADIGCNRSFVDCT